jgi:hypothetical protein
MQLSMSERVMNNVFKVTHRYINDNHWGGCCCC